MVRLEFPCGEVFTLAPLVALGIVPEPQVDPRGMVGTERWKAQGLEGKAFVEVDDSLAGVLQERIGKYRCRVVGASSPMPVMPRDVPPTPKRLRG